MQSLKLEMGLRDAGLVYLFPVEDQAEKAVMVRREENWANNLVRLGFNDCDNLGCYQLGYKLIDLCSFIFGKTWLRETGQQRSGGRGEQNFRTRRIRENCAVR